MMREHFYNLCRFRNERSAVVELRKRVSWYAKQMSPCKILREGLRLMNPAAEFDRVVAEFLDWRATRGAEVEGAEPADELAETASS